MLPRILHHLTRANTSSTRKRVGLCSVRESRELPDGPTRLRVELVCRSTVICLTLLLSTLHAQVIELANTTQDPLTDSAVPTIRRLPPTIDENFQSSPEAFDIDEVVLIALDSNKYLQTLSYRTPLWETRIDEAGAIFDPMFEIGGFYEDNRSPLASRITAAGTNATSQRRQSFEPPPIQNDNVSWSRRLGNGAVVQLNYSGIFERLDPAGQFRVVNPAWRSGVSAAIEQPLFRGAGIRANHAKIWIAQEFYKRAAHDIQQAMNYTVRTVRRGYWDLGHAIRVQEILAQANEQTSQLFEDEQKRFNIGVSTRSNVAQAKELHQRYRILELDARQAVIEQERRLRQIMGVPGFEPEHPADSISASLEADAPDTTLDWDESVAMAIELRPDLIAQRHHIQAYRHEVGLRENETEPDVRAYGRAGLGGLDRTWPGTFEEMVDGDNPGWMVGLTYRRPVNNCLADSLLRRAKLKVAQQCAVLKQLEHDAKHEMQRAYQAMIAFRERREMQRTRVEAANERFRATEKQYRSRKIGELDFLLRAQEAQTAAELGLARAKSDYRKAIEEWNYQRGAILAQWLTTIE